MNLILGNQKLVLEAYSSLVDQAAGNADYAYHLQFIETNGEAAYISALNGFVDANFTDAQLATAMLSNLGLTSIFAQADGEAYLAANAGNRAGAVIALADALSTYTGTNASLLAAKVAYNSDIDTAFNYSTDATNTVALDLDAAPSTSFTLTTGLDVLTGSSLDDNFDANVVQNSLGAQVNTLGSGDTLQGGAGTDTLSAKITAGAFIHGADTSTMPIQPETNSIELVSLQAVNSYIADNTNTEVFVNAKDMHGVTEIASNYSDANLTIQNLTTLDDGGSARAVSEMTVGMEYTGNADHQWQESDLSVYFDQDYLTTTVLNTRPGVVLQVMNEDAYDFVITAGGTQAEARDVALAIVFMDKLEFTLNGVTYDLATGVAGAGANDATFSIQDFEPSTGAGQEIQTYAELVEQMELALQSFKDANPTNAALQTVTVELGDAFQTAANDVDPNFQPRLGTEINLSVDFTTGGVANSLTMLPSALQITQADNAPDGQTANHRLERTDTIGTTSSQNLEINVALEKVGLAGDGGELIIGSMNKTAENEWDAVNTVTDTVSGINQFNVTVYGANDKSSSLSGLHSTNNNLKTVNVVTDAAQTGSSFADLTIGNSNTLWFDGDDAALFEGDASTFLENAPSEDNLNALKDVQTFDASGLQGDLTLFAGLSSEVTAKYLNVVDDAANAAADNVDFVYTGGTGDDYINLYLDGANLAQPGTSSREDMTLTVSGGAGDDEIVTRIDTSDVSNDNWYANQHINADLAIGLNQTVATGQLQLNGNAGDDTIRNIGSGDFAINGGTGDDTIYSDNTGVSDASGGASFNELRATWVFNDVAGQDVTDLESADAVSAITDVVNLNLTVSFQGFESTVVVGGATAGSSTGVSVTDLTINQAIKDAINNDSVLNKLLIAEDGPARTLIVRSLIDGEQLDSDVAVSLSSTALTTNQVLITDLHLLSDAQANALGFDDADGLLVNSALLADRFDSLIANDAGDELDGNDSANTSDSLIVGGTGDDVIVLSTGTFSNEGVGYAGFGNGTDTIVNFVATGVAQTTVGTDNFVSVVTDTQGVTGVIAADPVAATFELKVGAASINGNVVFTDDVAGTAFGDLGGGDLLVAVLAGDTAAEVADAIVAAWAGVVGTADYDVEVDPLDSSNLIFTELVPTGTTTPDQADLLAAVDGTAAGVTETVENITDGTFGTPEAVADNEDITVTFGEPTTSGLFQFDGEEFPILVNDSALDVANTFAAGAFTNWTVGVVTDNLDGTASVTLSSAVAEAVADVTIADFTGDINLATTTVTFVETGRDYLDFTSYGAEAVYVDGVLIAGTAAIAGQEFITLIESATNAGEYTMTEYTEGGTSADTVVGIIGVADFGATQAFVAENFLL